MSAAIRFGVASRTASGSFPADIDNMRVVYSWNVSLTRFLHSAG